MMRRWVADKLIQLGVYLLKEDEQVAPVPVGLDDRENIDQMVFPPAGISAKGAAMLIDGLTRAPEVETASDRPLPGSLEDRVNQALRSARTEMG